MKKGMKGMDAYLSMLMYSQREEFMDVVLKYIDLSDNKELWKEAAPKVR